MALPKPRIAVVLMQLGGPDSLEAVEPFLYNLFTDPDIIDFPFARIARKPLARFIASRRSKRVQHHYAEISGKSPILELTTLQARKLEVELSKSVDAKTFVAMRYWHPLAEETIREIRREKFDKIILIPMYPQYSKTTSGSSLNEWQRKASALGLNSIPTRVIKHFHDSPLYVEAVVERINEALARFVNASSRDTFLLFSAHGVPRSVIESGDPYKTQVEETVKLVTERGGWESSHLLCWQGKVGPAVWLKPYLQETIPQLATQGVKSLLVIPIAFVTDHIETLYEIDIEAREQATRLGITRFETMPALNDSPTFIKGLAELVLKQTQ
jgi:ferrochelatase